MSILENRPTEIQNCLECIKVVSIIVDFRINGTRQTGAVTNRTYRGSASVSLFLEFTIIKCQQNLATQNRRLLSFIRLCLRRGRHGGGKAYHRVYRKSLNVLRPHLHRERVKMLPRVLFPALLGSSEFRLEFQQ